MKARISRRALLGMVPAAFAQRVVSPKKPKPLPNVGEFARLVDPTTENLVVRLTALSSNAYLPQPTNRFVSTKERFLIVSSDRSGTVAPYRIDLRTGAMQQVASGEKVDARSITLDTSEKSLLLLDADQVKDWPLGSSHSRTVADGVREFVAGNGADDLLLLRGNSVERLDGKLIAREVEHLYLMHPAGAGCVYSRALENGERELLFAGLDGASCKRLARGKVSFPCWSGGGNSVLFLRESSLNGMRTAQIEEVDLQSLAENPVTGNGQFAAFSPNRNGSVFVSALQSKAQPVVTLMLRNPRREITLCEHHASKAAEVAPVFSPDSHRIYFESDREGKSAVYSINVELLVEPT